MKNEYEIRGEVTAIFINSPKYGPFEVEIDSADLQIANGHPGTWAVAKLNPLQGQFYVISTIANGGKKTTISLARLIMEPNENEEVFYADKNPLNLKRKTNLSCAYHYKRQQNRRDRHKSSKHSGVRGVHWCEQTGKWRAIVVIDKKYKNCGRFGTIEEAETAIKKVRAMYMTHSMMDK